MPEHLRAVARGTKAHRSLGSLPALLCCPSLLAGGFAVATNSQLESRLQLIGRVISVTIPLTTHILMNLDAYPMVMELNKLELNSQPT